MSEYESLLILAERKAELAMKADQDGGKMGMVLYLFGAGGYGVERRPGEGHNYHTAMEGLYRCSAHHPEHKVAPHVQVALERCAEVAADFKAVNMVLSYVLYQLKMEEDNEAGFVLDICSILNRLKASIQAKGAKISEGAPVFDGWIKQQDEYLQQKFGLRLLV